MNKFIKIIQNSILFPIFILTFFSLLFFGFLARHNTIADGDGFYHAKVAHIYSQGQWIEKLDSLPLTVLGESYTNHHFLYHAFLIPFVSLFDPLVGVKIAGVLLAVGVLLVWYLVAKNFGLNSPLWWALLNLTSLLFVYRLAMVKAVPLALIIFLFYLIPLTRYRVGIIFILNFIMVWTYGGWPLLPFVTLIFLISHFWIRDKVWPALQLVLASVLGAATGLLVNPFFPQNFLFYKAQIIDIAISSIGDKAQGQEWLPIDHLMFVLPLLPVWFLLAYLLFKIHKEKSQFLDLIVNTGNSVIGLTLALSSSALFLATVLSQRYIEFFSPLLILTVAWWYNFIYRHIEKDDVEIFILKVIEKFKLKYLLLLFVLVYLAVFVRIDMSLEKSISLSSGIKAVNWMNDNYDSDKIIFNLDWSWYPVFYYHGLEEKFILGLDPRLAINSATTDYWFQIYTMEEQDPGKILGDKFNTNTVILRYDKTEQLNYFLENGFSIIYDDGEHIILSFNNI